MWCASSVMVGPDGKQANAGTLLIPGSEVGPIMQALVKGLQEMQKQLCERTTAAETPALPTDRSLSPVGTVGGSCGANI